MTTAELLLARADYVDKGHPGVWGPDLEDAKARASYDRLLAEQAAKQQDPSKASQR